MAPSITSRFYFNGNAPIHNDLIRDLPIFAVTVGDNFAGGWASASADSKMALENIMNVVNVQVPVHVAMPRIYAHQYFNVGKEYPKLSIYAFRPMPGQSWQSDGGYMVGPSIAMVIKQISVTKITPIHGWTGLPAIAQVQKNYLERKIGNEAYAPMAVSLFVAGDTEVVE
ncbi:MAG TPA: hypothetical protein VL325_06395 [Pyrinomonadaceae bacterium]|nr:hypothetical protein [Pyrinomonadaceae bacterium]